MCSSYSSNLTQGEGTYSKLHLKEKFKEYCKQEQMVQFLNFIFIPHFPLKNCERCHLSQAL